MLGSACNNPVHIHQTPVFELREYVFYVFFRFQKKHDFLRFFWNDVSKSRKKSHKVLSLLNVYRNFNLKTPGRGGKEREEKGQGIGRTKMGGVCITDFRGDRRPCLRGQFVASVSWTLTKTYLERILTSLSGWRRSEIWRGSVGNPNSFYCRFHWQLELSALCTDARLSETLRRTHSVLPETTKSNLVQLRLLPSVGWQNEYQHAGWVIRTWKTRSVLPETTSHLGQLSLLPSVGWQNEYQHSGWVIRTWKKTSACLRKRVRLFGDENLTAKFVAKLQTSDSV